MKILKKGFVLYVIGTLLYFASWLILMYFPEQKCVRIIYTPLIWLIGIGLIGNSL